MGLAALQAKITEPITTNLSREWSLWMRVERRLWKIPIDDFLSKLPAREFVIFILYKIKN